MLTEKLKINKKCLFCASDYHLEMILLPYINKKIDQIEIVILTQNDLSETVNVLLNRINIKGEMKDKIRYLDWGNNDEIKIKNIKKYIKEKNNHIIIINGEYDYIIDMNNKLKDIINNENIEIIDCFHIGDEMVDINKISKRYRLILNTEKIY